MTLAGIAIVIVSCAALSALGVGWMRRWATRRRVLDVPNPRSSHEVPTPRGGGAVIALVVLAGGLLVCRERPWPETLTFLGGAGAIALLGWWDDLKGLPAGWRLLVQTLVAAAVVWPFGGFERIQVPWLGELELGAAGLLLAGVWIVGLLNAYNFMDGIDGIAGLTGVVAGAGWCAVAWSCGAAEPAWLGLILAAACAGFLVHNWAPARIFMGDVGSTFLGFVLAVFPLWLKGFAEASMAARLPWVGLLLVWPFVADTALTFVLRLARGENVLAAHRGHLYQRLVARGHSHALVAGLYGALAAAGGVGAVLIVIGE